MGTSDSPQGGQSGSIPSGGASVVGSAAVPWVLSARSDGALRDQAARLHEHVLIHPDAGIADIASSLVRTRSAFDHRAVIVGGRARLLDGLLAVRDDAETTAVTSGTRKPLGKTVFVFPGQGAQWAGMAGELLDTAPVFAETVRGATRRSPRTSSGRSPTCSATSPAAPRSTASTSSSRCCGR